MWNDLKRAPLRHSNAQKDYQCMDTAVPSVRRMNHERGLQCATGGLYMRSGNVQRHTQKRKNMYLQGSWGIARCVLRICWCKDKTAAFYCKSTIWNVHPQSLIVFPLANIFSVISYGLNNADPLILQCRCYYSFNNHICCNYSVFSSP